MSVFARLLGELVPRVRGRKRPALLLAATPDWRWLPRAGAAQRYPSSTLFRQRTEGDWAGVVDEVGRALGAWIGAARNP